MVQTGASCALRAVQLRAVTTRHAAKKSFILETGNDIIIYYERLLLRTAVFDTTIKVREPDFSDFRREI